MHRYREDDKNLRTEMGRIVDRAGVKRWPRIFQNLRASRETELCREYPLHVVTAWLGNTPKVAEKHYLDVTEEEYRRAASTPTQTVDNGDRGGAKSGAIGSEVVRKQCCTEWSQKEESPQIAGFRDSSPIGSTHLAPPAGLEPATRRLTAACSTN